jgi:hypothetical protein
MKLFLLRFVVISFLASAFLFPDTVPASLIDKTLTIQVFDVCNDAGANCASLGPSGNAYFAAEANKIWSQAGISVGFNLAGQIYSTHFSNINDSVSGYGLLDLITASGHGDSGTIVDMFLVHTIAGAYGEGWFAWGGIGIAMDTVMAYNGGLGRIDTIAHELGHNLGLVPTSLGGDQGGHSPSPNYLMASGAWRNVPTTLANIAPDGLGLDLLPADQIILARQSPLLRDVTTVPEPGSMVLVVISFGTLGSIIGLLRRRSSRNG